MTPAAALESNIFLFYLFAIVGLLAVAAGLLAIIKYGYHKNVDAVWKTYLGWLIMCPLMLGFIFAGRIAFIFSIMLVAATGFKEFARATGLYRDWWMTGSVYLAILVVGVTSIMPDPRTDLHGWYGLFMTLPVFAIAFLLMVPILRGRSQGQLQLVSLSIVGFIYIGWMFGHLGFLANAGPRAYGYICYLIVAVEINDIAAYIFGKSFGKRKLCPGISPNKTLEGSLGALAVSLALPWLLHFSFPHFGWPQLLLIGLIIGIGGQMGDLTISFIKRDIGIKDMGNTIPGHGGILDRIDSLIFTAPLFFHMVRWFYEFS
jgi:phosphatidate cytidylyltransferase